MLEFNYTPTFDDENGAGHVDNVLMYDWFNGRRQDLFATLGWTPEASGFFSIVSATINHLAEVFAGSPMTIRTGVKKVGRSSFVIWQTMEQGGQQCATLESVAVNVDGVSRKSQALSESMLASLTDHLVSEHLISESLISEHLASEHPATEACS